MTLKSSNYIIYLPPKFKVKCVQSAALQECVRALALPVCTPVTLTHVVTVATGVRSAVQNLDITKRKGAMSTGNRGCPRCLRLR